MAILAYTAKYASAFYGPFREAVGSSLKGDRKTYQQDPANVRESMRELALDLEEGADMVMVKPAGPYLDVLARIADAVDVPVAAYQISGEYSMIEAAAENDADDVLVTTGSQQALSLLATALLEPGDTVLVESPCYLAALQAFGFAGARIVAVPGDAEGLDPAALEELVVRERPKLLYTVPTFQNPTGRTLSAERRAAVASVAARRGLWVVEDDPYGELRFEGERVPWIASHEEARDRVVLLGSFSKVMAPGLRLGWLRAPGALRRACAVAKQAADLHTPTVNQLAAARYLADRDLDAHVERVAGVYRERRDAMLAGLGEALPEGSDWTRPEGGMFLWAGLPASYDTTALLPRVVRHDVAYVPGAPFYAGEPDRSTLRLCFVTQTPQEIGEGLRRLGEGLGTAPARRTAGVGSA
ncbi:Histidinol-phosphate aminotransferase [Streptomyces alboniger]